MTMTGGNGVRGWMDGGERAAERGLQGFAKMIR